MINNKDIEFYHENGYVILKNIISSNKINELQSRYLKLRRKLAQSAKIEYADYEKEISQIRDIWRYDDIYQELILKEEIAKLAPLFFENNGCRLLHDHIINKPNGNNGIVPWHQDYTYWPVDNSNGCSFWLAFEDLDKNAGVLQVVSKSHLLGEEQPVDFMNDDKSFDENDVMYLEVNKGDIVVLHSLTWHRTTQNISSLKRTAYISLWIDYNAKYAPKHADWHPVNDNITVKEGEIFNDDWFPSIGNVSSVNNEMKYIDNTSLEKKHSITMFNASKIVKKFLTKHIGQKECIWEYLYQTKNRTNTVKKLCNLFQILDSQAVELNEVLLSLAINGLAYKDHRGRNVYNKSYHTFKKIFSNEF